MPTVYILQTEEAKSLCLISFINMAVSKYITKTPEADDENTVLSGLINSMCKKDSDV